MTGSLNVLVIGECIALALTGWIISAFWRRGPTYYPAGRVLGVAGGVPFTWFAYLGIAYWHNPTGLLRVALDQRYNAVVFGLTLMLRLWALALIVMETRQRPGTMIGLLGDSQYISNEVAEFRASEVSSAIRHDRLNEETTQRLRRQLTERRRQRQQARGGETHDG